MARTVLIPTVLSHAGVAVALGAADNVNGNSFVNDGATILIARAPAGGANVTLRVNKIVDQNLIVPDRVIAIPANTTFAMGPFLLDTYTQLDGQTYIDYNVAGVTVLLLSVAS
jgi:hypothetical protein